MTTEIISPDTAIANIVAKAMIVPLLSSELLSLLAPIKTITQKISTYILVYNYCIITIFNIRRYFVIVYELL